MTSLLLTEATIYSQDDLNQIVREQIAQPYRQSDNPTYCGDVLSSCHVRWRIC